MMTSQTKMAKTRKELNAECALRYYHKNKDEVQRLKLIRRMERENYQPKASTLAKYNITQAETNLA